MVTAKEYRLVLWMLKLGLWVEFAHMHCARVRPRWGTGWLYRWLLKRQVVDDLHHAPACPANHWCRATLVFRRCTCGAAYHDRMEKEAPEGMMVGGYQGQVPVYVPIPSDKGDSENG